MQLDNLTVEVRDASLARVGQLLPSDLVGSEFVLRFRKVGAWKIVLPSDHRLADALREPGAGIIVTGPDGVLLSGPTVAAKNSRSASDTVGTWEITGVDDSVVLGERLAFPDPSTADVTAQAFDYDTRTGAAETVVKNYVKYNIGPLAPAARKISALTIEADLARGLTVTGNARFDKLGELLESLVASSNLGFTIDQQDDLLVFRVFEPVDRSGYVRMDVDNQRLEKAEYAYARPSATRVIVAGQGQGVDRTFVEVSSTESVSAETAWGRRIEVFKDQRNTNDVGELEQAGDEVLADGGFTIESVSVSPSDDQTMAFGSDWGLGDRVTVVVGDDEIVQVVTEVAIVVTDDGVKVGATVGDPLVAALSDTETATAAATADQESRISNLERNEPASGGNSGSVDWADVTGKPTSFTPSAHAASHASGGSDAITVAQSQVTGLSTALAGKVDTTDSRLTDARTPTAHASTHTSGGSDALTLAQSQVTNLTSDLAAKAPIASPTLTGTVTAPVLRLTDETDVSLTSTGHAFQIGPSSGTNIAIDGNEIMARNNGATSVLNLNINGGNVSIGDSTSTVTISGRISGTHYPYAVSAGSVSMTGNGSGVQSATVTFPSSRFSVAPMVTAASRNNTLFATVTAVSSTSATVSLRHFDNTAWSSTQSVEWHAIQMTSSAGAG